VTVRAELRKAGPESDSGRRTPLGRNVTVLGAVSFLTDVATEMMYPLLPLFLSSGLGVNAGLIGAIEGAAESTAALLKLASGWWSDRVTRRKPLVVLGYGIASLVRPLVAIAQTAGQVFAIRLTDRIGKGIRSAPRDALIADSVPAEIRGRAFGFHSAADNAGAVLGPLIAFALLHWAGVELRTVFWIAAIPGIAAMIALIVGVREEPRKPFSVKPPEVVEAGSVADMPRESGETLGRRFRLYLVAVFLFTLGNSTDAFLLLRAQQLGVPIAMAPMLWALLNLVKAMLGTYGGALSDRIGRKRLILAGWLWYAMIYVLFARAKSEWHAWALFAAYGLFYALTEGTQKALVADIVPRFKRGAAYGWYNLAIGLGALPASLVFGAVWLAKGAPAAFELGAAFAVAAAVAIAFVASTRMRTE
jgi:MFS family permease